MNFLLVAAQVDFSLELGTTNVATEITSWRHFLCVKLSQMTSDAIIRSSWECFSAKDALQQGLLGTPAYVFNSVNHL